MKVMVTGSDGQLGRALKKEFPDGKFADIAELDITDESAVKSFVRSDDYSAIINAAAFTNVDGCEDPANTSTVQAVNVTGVGYLAEAAKENDIPLVHISTDYVFDGEKKTPYLEGDAPNPMSVYGRSKLDSEKEAAMTTRHYILRTSWVIGDGPNFVRTMLSLAERKINPTVVADQIGRPTFTPVLAKAIKQLLTSKPAYGIYNVTNEGPPVSWADFTREIFKAAGAQAKVTNTTTEEYFADKPEAAKRPKNSVFDLTKAREVGIAMPNWRDSLDEYLKGEMAT